ncbi:MAG: ABC transporter permease [Brevibacterium sp.]
MTNPNTGIARTPRTRKRSGLRKAPSLIAGAVIMGILIVWALWMLLAPQFPMNETVSDPLLLPSGDHPLGTDHVGRDLFVRLGIAAGLSLVISAGTALLAGVVGTGLGLIAGYAGGWVDSVIMRIVDTVLSIPAILVALIAGVAFGTGPLPLICALGVVFAPSFARVTRGPVLVLKERDFVRAAEMNGVGPVRIALSHLLPNAFTPLAINFATVASTVVLVEAALSYLGQGVPAPNPSAGRMISESTRFMQIDPMLVILPTLLIVVLAIAWNLLADGAQEYLAPRVDVGLPGSRGGPKTIRKSKAALPADDGSTVPGADGTTVVDGPADALASGATDDSPAAVSAVSERTRR